MKIIKDKKNYIFLKDDFEVVILDEIVFKYKITQDSHFSNKTLQSIYDENFQKLAFEIAVKKLKNIKTKIEITNYLRDSNFDSDTIKITIDKLESLKLINDEIYSKIFINSKIRKYGKSIIRAQLLEKGVKIKIVDDLLNDVNEEEHIKAQLLKAFLKQKGSSNYIKNKMVTSLVQKGYDKDLSASLVIEYLSNKKLDDKKSLEKLFEKAVKKHLDYKFNPKSKINLINKLVKLGYSYDSVINLIESK